MRRVVVTGLGIVSSLGTTAGEVLGALRQGRSGLVAYPAMAEMGFDCHVYAPVREFDPEARVPKAQRTTTSLTAQYALAAAIEAVGDAGLDSTAFENDRAAVVVGSAFGDLSEATRSEQVLQARKSPSRLGGVGAVRMMNSTASGHLASYFHAQGRAYSISSSFATGVDSIGHAFELIGHGLQDLAICGSSDEAAWRNAGISFETTGSLANAFNDCPAKACRPYDMDRDGIILSEGAGILILETLDAAVKRGARIYAEVVGYGSANDGADMFRPSGQGLRLAVEMARTAAAAKGVEHIDYANSHATGTRIGDPAEVEVLRHVLDEDTWVSSTKGQAGHSLGATGAHEAVYTLLMLDNRFIAPTANLEHLDPACEGVHHAQTLHETSLRSALSVSIGFGGANACVVFAKPEGVSG